MVSPVRGDHRRFQAETPLIDLFKFAEPALLSIVFRLRQFRDVERGVAQGDQRLPARQLNRIAKSLIPRPRAYDSRRVNCRSASGLQVMMAR
jgi:hypothetical protein